MNNITFVFVQWLKRDLVGKYRGSWLGIFWPIIQPLAQVAIFTLVFHDFMSMRWPVEQGVEIGTVTQTKFTYAIHMLAGLSVFNFFAEILGRSPVCILSQSNLVTKVKFPIIILPLVTTGSAMIHIFVGCVAIWISSLIQGVATLNALWIILWIIPLVLYGVGLAIILSSIGIYVRDIVQIIPAFTSLLMFLTPIFYPLAVVNESIQWIFRLNPLTWAIESFRGILLSGMSLNLYDWLLHLIIAKIMVALCYFSFKRLCLGFGDVL